VRIGSASLCIGANAVVALEACVGGERNARRDADADDHEVGRVDLVAGTTGSTDFPTANALQPVLVGGVSDAFVAKLTPDGTALIYATYLGGSDSEGDIAQPEGRSTRVAVDAAGAAYVAGITRSSDFPVVRALQDKLKGDVDAFIAKLSADGSRLIYSTYLGGSERDQYAAIAIDLTGAAYISGSTFSHDFPTVSAFQPEWIGGDSPENAFVAKLTPDGTALAYATYLGGSGIDAARNIAVDSLGAAYVVGITTSENFPTVNPFSGARRGEWDSFVTKLAPDGKRLIYSTYLGGSDYEDGIGIALDASGAAYVIGETTSQDFPTKNPLQPVHGGTPADMDAYVAKLAPDGSALEYATFLGGDGYDRGYTVAVDKAGAAYVTGYTESRDFPTVAPLQAALRGPRDAFVAKLSLDGAALVYSTYLGGSSEDGDIQHYSAIALDLTGAAYVTGITYSPDFPIMQPLQATHGGSIDVFITKITDSDTRPVKVRPFKGRVNGETSFPFTALCSTQQETVTTATGVVAHLGRTKLTSRHCTQAGPVITGGHMTLVAANGDQVFLVYDGLAEPPGGVFEIHGRYEIVGGTGRFSGATGSGTHTEIVVFQGFEDPSWPITVIFEGTIGY
jgi:hypothetical protein